MARIVIVSARFGAGHDRAAYALADRLSAHEVEVLDFLDLLPPALGGRMSPAIPAPAADGSTQLGLDAACPERPPRRRAGEPRRHARLRRTARGARRPDGTGRLHLPARVPRAGAPARTRRADRPARGVPDRPCRAPHLRLRRRRPPHRAEPPRPAAGPHPGCTCGRGRGAAGRACFPARDATRTAAGPAGVRTAHGRAARTRHRWLVGRRAGPPDRPRRRPVRHSDPGGRLRQQHRPARPAASRRPRARVRLGRGHARPDAGRRRRRPEQPAG